MHLTRRHFVALALAPTMAALGGCAPPSPVYRGIDLANGDYSGDFSLTDSAGRRRTLADFRGHYLLLFFGYTQCPDVCPSALSRAVAIRELLGERKGRLKVAFLSVDPQRDTPPILDAYVRAFDPSFVGMSGSAQEVARAAAAYRVFYRQVPTGASYSVDHTALSYVIDPDGQVRLALRHAQPAQECAEDLQKLMRYDEKRKGGWR
ncbi:SCO family protein [Massilia sp. KIM]|uniref:SCO family protein n=1 Tax=Massilia sp. KIM TaxID=1955422 RepID=UPI00098F565B|nr:SCO family protein [Massilia sp. KIM]